MKMKTINNIKYSRVTDSQMTGASLRLLEFLLEYYEQLESPIQYQ